MITVLLFGDTTPACVVPKRSHKLLLCALVLAMAALCPEPASADTIEWQEPVRLTSQDSLAQYSSIVADPDGGIHVFWAYHADSDEPLNLLFYRYREETGWREPTDLFVGLDWEAFSMPYARLDNLGRIHLVWNGLQGLYYSSALASEAPSVSAWREPVLVERVEAIGMAGVVTDSGGGIHVVYSSSRPGTNVMYTHSEDAGLTWQPPRPLSDIGVTAPQVPDSASISVDGSGILHIVWSENYPPQYIGRQVLYSQSVDNGLTWTYPHSLSDLADESQWNGLPIIRADSNDGLHVIWAGCGNPVVSCCYRISTDGGTSWAATTRPFPRLEGSAGRDAMATDPYGHVYWAGSLRYPLAFYFSALESGVWKDPPFALAAENADYNLSTAHFPQMTVSEGNRLHILVVESSGGPLWYLEGRTSYLGTSAVVVGDIVTATVEPTDTTPEALVTLRTPPETPLNLQPGEETPTGIGGQAQPILVASLTAVLAVTLGALMIRTRRRYQ